VRAGALGGTGLALGLIAGALGAPLLRAFLFGVAPLDPAVFAGVAVLITAAAVAAGWLPARRAARTDPMSALRGD
jgi:ABC-type antimicrobial peptide transport system permease subunit